jgi:two-component system sensor histidine kinase ChiS
MLGTIGEEQRMETLVISNSVNLASRLEGLTKLYGAGILISEQTLYRLDEPKNYNCRFLGRVRVKGMLNAVSSWKPTGYLKGGRLSKLYMRNCEFLDKWRLE